MKAAAFDYLTPATVEDAVAALAAAPGEAKLIAGAQSLGPMLNLRLARPKCLVDVTRIATLRRIEDRSDALVIGGAVTHAEIEDARHGAPADGMLRSVAANIAYRAVRNRGTVAGSLAHADPAADWPLALAARDATIVARGPRGSRRIAVDGYMLGAYTTALADDEVIERVEVPKLSSGARWGYYKFCRKTGEFPEASAAVVMDPDRRVARVLLGALDAPPRRLDAFAAEIARTGAATPAACAAAVQSALPAMDAVARRMHAAALHRAVQQVFA